MDAAASGRVDHVDHHHGRQAQTQRLGDQRQIPQQVRRIDHDHQHVGHTRVQALRRQVARQHGAADARFGQSQVQRIDARQVDQRGRAPVPLEAADEGLLRGAGEVGGLVT